MKTSTILFCFSVILLIAGCQTKPGSEPNPLQGNWAFLDKFGNYNEVWFGDSLYATYNKIYQRSPKFRYVVRNDSLWSDVDKRKKGMSRIARIHWLNDDRVILNTEFVRDTLFRMSDVEVTLGNTDPKKDSARFAEAFNLRYEEFLISRNILTREEVEQFREENRIPTDVEKELRKSFGQDLVR